MENGRQASAAPALAAQQTAFDNVALIVALVMVGLVILLAFVVLSLISQGALAESVAAIDRGERRRFSTAFRAGVSNFWPVLGQILLFMLLFIVLGIGFLLIIGIPIAILVLGTFAATGSAELRILFVAVVALIAIGLLIVVFIPLVIVAQFALRELVVGGERVFDSIRGGYHLFRPNLGRRLLLWLIQVVLVLAAGLALVIAAILVGLVLFIPTIILAIAEYATAAILTGVVAGLILPAAHPSGDLRHSWHFQPQLLDSCLPPALHAGRRSRPAARSRGMTLRDNAVSSGLPTARMADKPLNRKDFRHAKLDGKVAVITGASSGIAEATAEALSAEGAAVVVAARREDRLDDLVGRINGNGGQALAVECDVTDEEQQAHDLIRRAKDEFGRVDVLVNNAGVMLLSNIDKGLSEEWRQMFDVNASCTAT